ncbi:unknown [Acidiphilium sp. CAG:727]|nr:unknown [Acidiphilium sp. CAG:727]
MQRFTPYVIVFCGYIGGQRRHKTHYSRAADSVQQGIEKNIDKRRAVFGVAEPYFSRVRNFSQRTARIILGGFTHLKILYNRLIVKQFEEFSATVHDEFSVRTDERFVEIGKSEIVFARSRNSSLEIIPTFKRGKNAPDQRKDYRQRINYKHRKHDYEYYGRNRISFLSFFHINPPSVRICSEDVWLPALRG